MKLNFGTIIKHNAITAILTGVAVALLIASFCVPPTGVIDASVLKGVSVLFLFAALWTLIIAMYRGSDVSFKHNDTEIAINNDREEDANKD